LGNHLPDKGSFLSYWELFYNHYDDLSIPEMNSMLGMNRVILNISWITLERRCATFNCGSLLTGSARAEIQMELL
jgi:hypothetical protein